jgi:hypothetical protein
MVPKNPIPPRAQPRPADPPVPPPEPGELLTPEQAGKVLHLSARTLEGFRHTGLGPAFAKLGAGRSARVRYRREDLDAWVADRIRKSTTEG